MHPDFLLWHSAPNVVTSSLLVTAAFYALVLAVFVYVTKKDAGLAVVVLVAGIALGVAAFAWNNGAHGAVLALGILGAEISIPGSWLLCYGMGPPLRQWRVTTGVVLLVAHAAILIVLFCHGLDAQTIQPQHVIYDSTAQTARLVTRTTRLWKADLAGCHVFPAEMEKIEVVMTLHPITPNPKVRDISYHVVLRAKDTPAEQDLARWQATAATDDIRQKVSWKVQWRLYNLNDERSKELSRFSNPLDSDQQALFGRLVRPAVEEALPSWMVVESISFRLP